MGPDATAFHGVHGVVRVVVKDGYGVDAVARRLEVMCGSAEDCGPACIELTMQELSFYG